MCTGMPRFAQITADLSNYVLKVNSLNVHALKVFEHIIYFLKCSLYAQRKTRRERRIEKETERVQYVFMYSCIYLTRDRGRERDRDRESERERKRNGYIYIYSYIYT